MSKKKKDKDKKAGKAAARDLEIVRPAQRWDFAVPDGPPSPPPGPTFNLNAELTDCANAIQLGLASLLSDIPGASERLTDAMRHGALNGGKRIRPFLVRLTAQMFGESPLRSRALQLGVELIHCYSLIHDDLPAMDNDDLRRGRPTVHKAYDEATAILAGDALLAHAFHWLATRIGFSAETNNRILGELAEAAGPSGMVGGQMRDMEAEANEETSLDDIALMMNLKTGRLIRASVRVGAIYGGADDESLEAVTRYAEIAGAVFQMADDLLDFTADTATLGKTAGKDEAAGKQTLVSRLGVKTAQKRMDELVEQAIAALSRFGPEADGLRATVRYFAARPN
jgi:farnesyl diphosphate synthase